jgi:selenocysteine lyase/cysteine desulfurase
VTVSTPLPYEESSTIVAFSVDGLRGEEIISWCQDRNILVAAHLERAVRISAHVYNTKEEVDQLVDAVRELQHSMAEAEVAAAEEAPAARL